MIYKQRQQVLDDEDLTETLRHMIHETIEATVLAHTADDHAENWGWTDCGRPCWAMSAGMRIFVTRRSS